jgi:hypothetical protein
MEAFSMAWRIMIMSVLPPVLLKIQVMRIETGSMNIRNAQKGVLL